MNLSILNAMLYDFSDDYGGSDQVGGGGEEEEERKGYISCFEKYAETSLENEVFDQ